jgi:RNA polymerase sigma-70 factor (ECF subfamily)
MTIETAIQLSDEQLGEFCAFFEGDYKAVVALLIKAGASLGDAEDAAQEAMHAALRQWPAIERRKSFTRKVAFRALYRAWGKAKREKLVLQVGRDEATAPFEAGEDAGQALKMLKSLPTAQRLVFALHVDGYEPADIAEITGQHPDTVRSNLRHARQKLIRKLDPESIKKEATHGP